MPEFNREEKCATPVTKQLNQLREDIIDQLFVYLKGITLKSITTVKNGISCLQRLAETKNLLIKSCKKRRVMADESTELDQFKNRQR
jgi:hypothetical protein